MTQDRAPGKASEKVESTPTGGDSSVLEIPAKVVAIEAARRAATEALWKALQAKTRTSLDEGGRQRVEALFNSQDAGYERYALPALKEGLEIDPDHLPEGSAPFWTSPEEALIELQYKLTLEQLTVIESEMSRPTIVIEPIMQGFRALIKKEEGEDSLDSSFLMGSHLIRLSSRMERELGLGETPDATEGRIIGWKIGIAEGGEPKWLCIDGDIWKRIDLRAGSFRRVYGEMGFTSTMDSIPLFCMLGFYHINQGTQQSYMGRIVGDIISIMETKITNKADVVRMGGLGSMKVGHSTRGYVFLSEEGSERTLRDVRIALALMFDKA